jgi:hypothetical protein
MPFKLNSIGLFVSDIVFPEFVAFATSIFITPCFIALVIHVELVINFGSKTEYLFCASGFLNVEAPFSLYHKFVYH